MCDAESQKQIRKFCIRLLTRREHSQKELLNKSATKGFDQSEVQIIIDYLAEQGWQSDQRFAESYARHRIKKGYGPIKIRYELWQRGIDDFDLESVVLEITDGWLKVLKQVYEKKYADDRQLSHKEWLKRSRFLQQRGFSNEMIKMLFKP